MINSSIVTKVYLSFINDEITQEQANNKLIIMLLEYPNFFGLESLCKESLQDFIGYFVEIISKVFKNYDPDKSVFSTYFQSTVRYAYLEWRKTYSKNYAQRDALTYIYPYENTEKNEENLYVYSPDIKLNSQIEEKAPLYYPKRSKNARQTELTELEILVITLKSSYYITNENIQRILNNVNISKFQLTNYIKELNEKLIKKISQKKALETMTSKDYIKMQILKSRCKNLNYSNSYAAKTIREKYLSIKKKRAKRLERLKRIRIVPSDNEVSKMLNITPAQVRYILTKNYKIYNIKA